MLDFVMVSTKTTQKGVVNIFPKFIVKKTEDLLIRGGDFYAVWVESENRWSTDEHDCIQMIDHMLYEYYLEHKDSINSTIIIDYLWDATSGSIDSWHKYCQKQMRDMFVTLDENLTFQNTITDKKSYSSKKLSYSLIESPITAYSELMSILYSPENRHKIEWAIGSIVNGDSKYIQKFIVLYGAAGTGKSTIINIIQQLFDGYYSVFDSKALGNSSNAFALEAFKSNPLVAVQHDGDLSRIEDNTKLNSLVSHEEMSVNEKFKGLYSTAFKSFLILGTNRPVKITDAKSGLIRRLIDVSPTGELIPVERYDELITQIPFELGGIAYHCKTIYEANKKYYANYIPTIMMGASNDFYNFVLDSYYIFEKDDTTSLKQAWELYKNYCDYARVAYPLSQRAFKEELKNYFEEYQDRAYDDQGNRIRNVYKKFITDKFEVVETTNVYTDAIENDTLNLMTQSSLLDIFMKDCPAQNSIRTDDGRDIPSCAWSKNTNTLKDINTSQIHYVKPTEQHIVIDFDIKHEGKKSLKHNIEAASRFPKTYTEISKGGNGIHLHYIYDGDINKLSSIYGIDIEIKKFVGNASLRRKLTKCNNIEVQHISSGLPLKGDHKVYDKKHVENERHLRIMILKNLHKEFHPGTKPSIDFIKKLLDDAYNSNMPYDVTDMIHDITVFASNSTNQANYCLSVVKEMKFFSETESEWKDAEDDSIVFYDVEVFPNLFLLNWKFRGKDKIYRMINPKPHEVEAITKFNLVGFNCRKYDNHIIYAAMMGYSNMDIYRVSKAIINGEKDCFFREAYNISYTDIYDFVAKKQSLKKWEYELGITHKELGFDWDLPVPENKWIEVSEYCDNDVIATEAVFEKRQADFAARKILSTLTGLSLNHTNNQHTTRMIFGNNKKPQGAFNYRFMGDVSDIGDTLTLPDGTVYNIDSSGYTLFNSMGQPIFKGYQYSYGKSTYRDVEVGEGGYVYAVPGMYTNVALLDVASMHPTSAIMEVLFGEEFTRKYEELLKIRIAVKHKQYDLLKNMFDGQLIPYLDDDEMLETLSFALKIVINSVYGLTAASFECAFKDVRNIDNIVAKRGALFMINLKHEVLNRNYKVAHIKTDSIKIPDADEEVIEFIHEYGRLYGYTFEHEATYERFCLVNNAVYIAKYLDGKKAGQWTATGAQFAVPYVFKTLFSKEELTFEDYLLSKSVVGSMYLDYNEKHDNLPSLEKELDRLKKKQISLTKKGNYDEATSLNQDIARLTEDTKNMHEYAFIGRVGQFVPVKPGCDGGQLMRLQNDQYYAVSGTTGYRFMEAEHIKNEKLYDIVDVSYFEKLADDAKEAINKHHDFEDFVNLPTEELARVLSVPF